jgi:hypothetical protein
MPSNYLHFLLENPLVSMTVQAAKDQGFVIDDGRLEKAIASLSDQPGLEDLLSALIEGLGLEVR